MKLILDMIIIVVIPKKIIAILRAHVDIIFRPFCLYVCL